jgi:hypothetical protein
MARDFDFTESEKNAVKAEFNFVCAACGADDSLHVDHWIAGNKDIRVCLCYACNGAKGKTAIPAKMALKPRNALNVISHSEYKFQVEANRKVFAKWVSIRKGTAIIKQIAFQSPY